MFAAGCKKKFVNQPHQPDYRAQSIDTYLFGARELDISIYPWFALSHIPYMSKAEFMQAGRVPFKVEHIENYSTPE